ncbi:MAG: FAD-dependent oxidoreductase [Sphingobium sp.]
MSEKRDLFIIGAGIAGLSAAERAAERGLKVAIAEENMFGGLVMNVNHIHPAPEGAPASGSDWSADLMTRISDLGVDMIFDSVTALSRTSDGSIILSTAGGDHSASCVVVASGARLRKLGIPGEAEFEHKGVSSCADCNAPLFRNMPVAVVGGGDSALQEALVLADFCSVVHLIHRGDRFSGRQEFADAVAGSPRIDIRFHTVVEALEGDTALSAIRLRDTVSGETSVEPCQGFFAYVGLEPNTSFLPPQVETAEGRVQVDSQLESSMENLFAIGAARAGYGGLLSDAVGDAAQAVDAIGERLARQ